MKFPQDTLVFSAEKVIKIGVFEPASGDSASGGKKETLGIQYANQETPSVEVNGVTYQVKLEIADNGSSTDKSPTAASDLVAKDVAIVLGSYGSGVSGDELLHNEAVKKA